MHFFLDELRALAVALQETHLNSTHTNTFRRHHIFRKDRTSSHSSGGVAVVVRGDIACTAVPLRSPLEAVAVRILADRLITLVSLYLPPDVPIDFYDLQDLLNQLPKPFLILGDFNAHNPLWGSARLDNRGKVIERFLLSSSLCLLNSKQPTFYSASHNTFTCIDLSISSATLFPCFSWKVLDDPLGSDHFPIVLESHIPLPTILKRIPRWKLDKADWGLFQLEATLDPLMLESMTPEEATLYVTEQIINAAHHSIPKTSTNLPKRCKPWWTQECSKTRRNQKRAWDTFRRYPIPKNLMEFRKRKAKARWTRKQAKRTSWKKYVSSLSSAASPKEVWDRYRKIRGDYRGFIVPPLFAPSPASLKDIGNALGMHFQGVSSSDNYNTAFKLFKRNAECQRLKLSGANSEPYNKPFTVCELKLALDTKKQSSPGPDSIHYEMLRRLSLESFGQLLKFFNRLWEDSYFPDAWKCAHVIPFLKPGKDPSCPSSYRPIALTSCLGKTYERLINRRLVYFLETNNILDKNQCGFRQGRSTLDHLVRLETLIREAFVNRQHCVSVFFDLEKAYDTTWRHGILQDLLAYGVRGRMLRCIKAYLTGRTFQVRLGTTLSDIFVQENGVPQGGVLSVTLFAIKINTIAKVIPRSIAYSLYVDDLQISSSSCNPSSCERQLQLAINKISKWADENGFRFSAEKTVCVPFSLRRGISLDPALEINRTPIVVKAEHKFLGIIFDKKLNFNSHLQQLKQKCLKSLNILKVLSHKTWGSDRKVLLRLYNSLVRSRLDYGAIVYNSARPSSLKMLDPVHHLGLRLATGAFRTSPVLSLYVESHQMSLAKRRQYLGLSYASRIMSDLDHPTFTNLQRSRYARLFENKPRTVRPLSFRVGSDQESLELDLHGIELLKKPLRIAPWELLPVFCDWTFTRFSKHSVSPLIIQQEFVELQKKYSNYVHFYTDGSKSSSSVGTAVYSEEFTKAQRLEGMASIFTAELYGVLMAIEYIMASKTMKAVLFVDSQSVVSALGSVKDTKNKLAQLVRFKINSALVRGHDIKFCWIPSHIGILGNEKADQLATSTKNLAVTSTGLPYQDMKPLIKKALLQMWQSEWDQESENKLHVVKPGLGLWESASHENRFIEVLHCRLRIGHSFVTHGHLLCGGDAPVCEHCGESLTVLHILWLCSGLEQNRRTCFPEFFTYNIPFHPALLVGEHPIIPFNRVITYLEKSGFLRRF